MENKLLEGLKTDLDTIKSISEAHAKVVEHYLRFNHYSNPMEMSNFKKQFDKLDTAIKHIENAIDLENDSLGLYKAFIKACERLEKYSGGNVTADEFMMIFLGKTRKEFEKFITWGD